MDITALTAQFQTSEELRIFCSSQYKQIIQLTKKNKELEEKLLEAKKNSNTQLKQELTSPLQINPDIKILDDAKTIAQVQLRMLKESAFDKELTLEEAKRVEIFNRILNDQTKPEKSTLKADAKVLRAEDLLKLVEDVAT